MIDFYRHFAENLLKKKFYLLLVRKTPNFARKMAEDEIPLYTPFFGVMGATAAMVFTGMV